MKLYSSAVLLCSLFLSLTAFSKAKTESCDLKFAFDSSVLDEKALDACIEKIDASEIEFFHILATASYPGTTDYNQALSARRADAVEAYLRKRFAKVTIERAGAGEHPAGKAAKVIAVMSTVDKEAVSSAVSDFAKKIEDERLTRISIRGSFDNYRVNKSYTYRSIGLELARLSRVCKDNYYGEIGLNIIRHNHDDRMDLYSINGLVGGYAKFGMASMGLRGVVGNLSLENNKDNTINAGGELRLGAEWSRYAIFAVGGLTKEFKTVGLDFAVKI